MSNHADVTGVAIDGETYCTNCANEDEGDAIFAGSEWSYQPCCGECGEDIGVIVLASDDPEKESVLAPCSVCESTDICCGDQDNGLCVDHCSHDHRDTLASTVEGRSN